MTIQDLINLLAEHPLVLLIVFIAIPGAAYLGGLLQGEKQCKDSNIRYFYAVLVYAACIPGIFAVVLTGYSLFFARADFLSVNLLIYILPIASMAATLIIIKKKNGSFDHIPGFDRLLGFMLIMGISFAVAFVLYRAVIFIGFVGKLFSLLVIAVVVFILLKMAYSKMTRKNKNGN